MRSVLVICGVFILTSALWAQKAKSNKEIAALNAINGAQTPDDRIKAIENVLTNFKDTEFKPMLLLMAMQLETQKGDYAQVMFYGERVLETDPKNAFAMVTMASETARKTREFDLDKEEKLAKVDKWAKDGIEAAKTAPKPQQQITDEQWEGQRKDFQSQGYEALGMAAALRKKYEESIADYKQSIAVAANPDPATWLRLGQTYIDAGKLDEATDAFDKGLNAPNASPQVKSIAQGKKAEIAKVKAGGAKPSGNAPPPAAAKQPN
ncbi:MAG TPA: tetratricopeptide repeat protein [Bryobacteraceae bacterium]|nr:tetratricopeptide repeat protein [Bryobacteraceae bacterium]